MQKHPLLSVKQAAEMLHLEERSVRERLINGQLKGEKRNVGLREKWFVYRGAVEAALAKEGSALEDLDGPNDSLSPASPEIPIEANPHLETLMSRVQELEEALKKNALEESSVAADPPSGTKENDEDIVDALPPDNPNANDSLGDQVSQNPDTAELSSEAKAGVNSIADQLWNNLIARYQVKLEEKDQTIGTLRSELDDKERQLKLLPDYKKKVEAAERKVFQEETLRKEVELQVLEKEALRKQVAALQAKHDEAHSDEERLVELGHVVAEREAETRALQGQLKLLQQQVQDLQKPWWKKWFLPAPQDPR